ALGQAWVHGVRDYDAGSKRQGLGRGGDRYRAFGAPLGGLDGRESHQREAGAAWAANHLVRAHGLLEGAPGAARIPDRECGPAYVAMDARDLGQVADGLEEC